MTISELYWVGTFISGMTFFFSIKILDFKEIKADMFLFSILFIIFISWFGFALVLGQLNNRDKK